MHGILRFARQFGAQALHASGLLRIIVKSKLKDRCVVITYHRVLDSVRIQRANSHPGIVVSDNLFEMQMRTLRREFNPISLSEFSSHLETGAPFPSRSCLVTFDDGWLDNYEVAYPILKKYEIPAVIFLPVDYISANDMFWQEETIMRLSSLREREDPDSIEQLNRIMNRPGSSKIPSDADVQQFVARLKSLEYAQLEQHLYEVRERTPSISKREHYNRYLTWAQVLEMRDAGIDFASHGLSHRILSALSGRQRREELAQSRKILKDRIGEEIRAIAYPNGGYDESVVADTAEAGYKLAFTTQPGFVNTTSNPLLIPRINLHDGNSDTEARFISTCARVL